MTQKIAHAEIVKVDEEKRLVFGWASIIKDESGKILLDRQDDFIDSEDELEGAAYDYVLNSRDGGEMHVRRGVSKMVESVVFTEEKQRALGIPVGSMPTGWWIGFKVTDNSVWNQVKKGEYAGFSVHGSGRRESTELPLSKITEIGKAVTTKKISISEMASKTQMFNTELSKGDKPGHPFRGNQHTGGGKGKATGGGQKKSFGQIYGEIRSMKLSAPKNAKISRAYTRGFDSKATGKSPISVNEMRARHEAGVAAARKAGWKGSFNSSMERGGQLITPVGSRTGSGTAPKANRKANKKKAIPKVGVRPKIRRNPPSKIGSKVKGKRPKSSSNEMVPSDRIGFVVPKGSPYALGAKKGVKGKRPKIKRGK